MRFLLPLLMTALLSCSQQSNGTPPELGTVSWLTDHDKALALSQKSGKPVFLLFQEVPG